ncbi:MAG: MurR/RpiR family transcriptional regulator [Geminicoccaceae bacterium]
MDQSQRLPQRILELYDDMPRGERRLAELLLEHPSAIVEQSATNLAARAAVSKATAARLFKRLGYPSFKTAQRAAREHGIEPPPVPYGARVGALGGHQVDLSLHLQSDVRNLVRTIEQQRSDDLNTAVRALARAEKLWVVGFGDNYPLAHFARALLIRVRPDIRMIPIGGFSVPEEFASISSSDTMLAFGIGRRTRSLRSIVRSAVRAGAKLVFVTDQTGTLKDGGDGVSLRCRTMSASVFDSLTAPVSLMTYLCSALAARLGETAIERLRVIDGIHEEWGELTTSEI